MSSRVVLVVLFIRQDHSVLYVVGGRAFDLYYMSQITMDGWLDDQKLADSQSCALSFPYKLK
jgi:hypothetical protein